MVSIRIWGINKSKINWSLFEKIKFFSKIPIIFTFFFIFFFSILVNLDRPFAKRNQIQRFDCHSHHLCNLHQIEINKRRNFGKNWIEWFDQIQGNLLVSFRWQFSDGIDQGKETNLEMCIQGRWRSERYWR